MKGKNSVCADSSSLSLSVLTHAAILFLFSFDSRKVS